MGLMAQWPIPDEPPSYEQSLTKKQMNKCMAEI